MVFSFKLESFWAYNQKLHMIATFYIKRQIDEVFFRGGHPKVDMGRYQGGRGSKMAKNWRRLLWTAPMWKDQVERSKSLILMWVCITEKEWKETYLFWRLQLKIPHQKVKIYVFWFWYLFWIYSISVNVYFVNVTSEWVIF